MIFASKISSKSNFSGTGETFTIENGEPIRVRGILFSNKNGTVGNRISFTMRNGTQDMGNFTLSGLSSFTIKIPFLADAGLSFFTTAEAGSSSSDFSVTVFHSSPGA